MLRPAFRRCFAPGAFIPTCGQGLVDLLVDYNYSRLQANRVRVNASFVEPRSYRIRLHSLTEVIALEQRQLAGIFLIVLIVFFFVLWWLLAYQFRVLG